MKNIRDLHFEKEILPLFDFAGNEFSREALIRLLSEIPSTLEEVLMRQQVLRCLLSIEKLQAPAAGAGAGSRMAMASPGGSASGFLYSKSEFNEVYRTVEEIRNREDPLPGRLYLFFFKSKRDRESGRLNQLILFFYKLRQAYYANLRPEEFPEVFGARLKSSIRFLADLEIEKYQAIVRGRGLYIAEIARLMEKLGEKIREGEMDIFWEDFFLLEAYLSVSRGIRRHGFTFPVFKETGLSIREFYHPLLKNPVRNSLTVRSTVILITGPNMSGKSTLLKAIGLCVLLGHLGLAVPAEECELSFFEVISIAINLNDDIQSGYSHFMSEVKTLKNVVLEAAGPKRCFAIFDELFRGTNAEDALAISRTTISGLTKFTGSCFFISTHLHQLRDVVKDDRIGMHYIECELGQGRPVFTYRLRSGWSDLKIGQIIFDQEGLNELLGG
ncbi:MAG TPA: hypothetical protein VNS58_19215 [Puia sp.]|nr:hypothetical protein [Puia sp.]